MVQIFNLQSIGQDLFVKTYNSLTDFVNFLNSEYCKQTEIEHIQKEDLDIIQIGGNQDKYIWNFLVDISSNINLYGTIEKYLAKSKYPELHQNALITSDLPYLKDRFDVILVAEKQDIESLLIDYISIFDPTRFPNNCGLQDLFEITNGRILNYYRMQYTEIEFENQISDFYAKKLDRIAPLLLYIKGFVEFNLFSIRLLQLIKIFSKSVNYSDFIAHFISNKDNEISVLIEKKQKR